jgi:hypothetical protein
LAHLIIHKIHLGWKTKEKSVGGFHKMRRKSLLVLIIALALGAAFVLAKAAPVQKTHAGEGKVTFSGMELKNPKVQEKLNETLNNLIGIDTYSLNPKQNSVTVTFDYESMRASWIEKALESAGFHVGISSEH